MSVMTTMLRRHGATLVERHGRLVAVHYGSPAAEAAVCRSSVGLAERSDRATLELGGIPTQVEQALAELAHVGGAAWWVRRSPQRALVRCEGEDADATTALMLRAEDATVVDISRELAAIDLVGPHAEDVLRAHEAQDEAPVALVVRRDATSVELLVPRVHGPALWASLLEDGDPFGIACVGLEALEHLAAAERAGQRRSRTAASAT